MARPKLVLDVGMIEKLASIHCTNEEIASIIGCHKDTLTDRYSDLLKKSRDKGKSSLRRHQWELAQKGNATMLIWLGKQLLGQTDKTFVENSGEQVMKFDTTKEMVADFKSMFQAHVSERKKD